MSRCADEEEDSAYRRLCCCWLPSALRYMISESVALRYACVVDLRHRRTVHCVEHYPCLPDPQRVSGTSECGAVHYGYCVPIMIEDGGPSGSSSPRIRLDPVVPQLLASPELNDNLKSLVDRFVAQDRAAMRKPKDNINRMAADAAPPPGSPQQTVVVVAKRTDSPPGIRKSDPITDGATPTEVAVKQKKKSKTVDASQAATSNGQQQAKVGSNSVMDTFEPHAAEETLGQLLQDLKVAVKSTEAVEQSVAASSPVRRDECLDDLLVVVVEEDNNKAVADGSGKCRGPDDDYVQSPIDYAKRRFLMNQTAALTNKVDSSPRGPINGIQHLVSETKSRFENGIFHQTENKWKSEWVPTTNCNDSLSPSPPPSSSLHLHPEYGGGGGSNSPKGSLTPPRKSPSPEPGSTSPLPHPKLTSMQKQHIRERALAPVWLAATAGLAPTTLDSAASAGGGDVVVVALHQQQSGGGGGSTSLPIRPFLTKGSVAERVLIFERCPILDKGSNRTHQAHYPTKPLFNTWRTLVTGTTPTTEPASARTQVREAKETQQQQQQGSPKSCQKRVSIHGSNRHLHIARFHYPHGRPLSSNEVECQLQRIPPAFVQLPGQKATRDNFGTVAKACQLPLYWKCPLFVAAGGEKRNYLTCDQFLEYWKRLSSTCHDDATKFVRILTRNARQYLLPEDFVPLIQDVIDTHPGLTFLKEATEFHSRYVHTVIARVYYCANRSWSGQITIPELRRSNFLQVLSVLEQEEDINQVTEYFSYEHFYVIYCKFWELDKDHDLMIDKTDLSHHNENAISSRMIERIFSGAVTRGRNQEEGKMGYSEFVWFLLSEEDKRHPTSIEYWFRCMDLDGDGFLSMYELEYFYEEQLQRMEALGIETLPFQDCLCQMLDMIQPKVPGKISLSDLKKCKMTPIFFDTFFNLEKYLDHEQRDPFASHRDQEADGSEISDWNRYAAEEYELLVAEEGAAEHQDDLMYEDFAHGEELSANLERLALNTYQHHNHGNMIAAEGSRIVVNSGDRRNNGHKQHLVSSNTKDDYTDYADSDDYPY